MTLGWDGQTVRSVGVRSTRPLVAPRVLTGKTAVDAAATVPLLYSICGGAQGAAAACALAAAGAAGFERTSVSRDTGIVVESLQEGFWHLLIGWPNAMGSDPQVTPVTAARYLIATSTRKSDGTDLLGDADAMRALAARLSDIATRAMFGIAPAAWLDAARRRGARRVVRAGRRPRRPGCSRTCWPRRRLHRPRRRRADAGAEPRRAAARRGARHARRPGVRAHADVGGRAGGVERAGADARRIRWSPRWTRIYGHAAVTRIVARMVEIGALLAELGGAPPATAATHRAHRASRWATATDWAPSRRRAVSCCIASRVHDECVVDYRIVAPTEWNFHPDGALVRGLTGTTTDRPGGPAAPRAARRAFARSVRRVPRRDRPCMRWRSRRA